MSEKESIAELFGKNVKKYRKEAGLTQEHLSERLGISQKHLSIIETGTQFASASLIGRISKELNVSPGNLFGGTSNELAEELKKTRDYFQSELNSKTEELLSKIEEIKEAFREK
ncbi:MAG: helix-turn-helix domain-containing protein [Treponema sp.]|nr:helix-turn-helix domain-containing protein [Treponema sp.]